MRQDKAAEFAKQQGYDAALYIGKWRGYDVYEPVFSGEEAASVGVPLVILSNGEGVRMSTIEEAFAQLNGE